MINSFVRESFAGLWLVRRKLNPETAPLAEFGFDTDPAVHVPPFRIRIMHQQQETDLSGYGFTISYQLMY